eukprot:3433949-Rhodomonas_salina.1
MMLYETSVGWSEIETPASVSGVSIWPDPSPRTPRSELKSFFAASTSSLRTHASSSALITRIVGGGPSRTILSITCERSGTLRPRKRAGVEPR